MTCDRLENIAYNLGKAVLFEQIMHVLFVLFTYKFTGNCDKHPYSLRVSLSRVKP